MRRRLLLANEKEITPGNLVNVWNYSLAVPGVMSVEEEGSITEWTSSSYIEWSGIDITVSNHWFVIYEYDNGCICSVVTANVDMDYLDVIGGKTKHVYFGGFYRLPSYFGFDEEDFTFEGTSTPAAPTTEVVTSNTTVYLARYYNHFDESEYGYDEFIPNITASEIKSQYLEPRENNPLFYLTATFTNRDIVIPNYSGFYRATPIDWHITY